MLRLRNHKLAWNILLSFALSPPPHSVRLSTGHQTWTYLTCFLLSWTSRVQQGSSNCLHSGYRDTMIWLVVTLYQVACLYYSPGLIMQRSYPCMGSSTWQSLLAPQPLQEKTDQTIQEIVPRVSCLEWAEGYTFTLSSGLMFSLPTYVHSYFLDIKISKLLKSPTESSIAGHVRCYLQSRVKLYHIKSLTVLGKYRKCNSIWSWHRQTALH